MNPEAEKKELKAEDIEKRMHRRREESPMATKLRKFRMERTRIEGDLKHKRQAEDAAERRKMYSGNKGDSESAATAVTESDAFQVIKRAKIFTSAEEEEDIQMLMFKARALEEEAKEDMQRRRRLEEQCHLNAERERMEALRIAAAQRAAHEEAVRAAALAK